jgi:thymidylate kinase
MHIVLTGAHGVGKSTLCECLIAELTRARHVALIPETARDLVRRGFKVNDEITEEGFISYIQLYLANVRKTQADIVISDRSLFDLYLYTHRGTPFVRQAYIEMLHELVFVEAKLVDFYVYLPIEFPMPLDAVRPPDAAYQALVDRDVADLLRHFGMRTVIARGSLAERCRIVIERLENG